MKSRFISSANMWVELVRALYFRSKDDDNAVKVVIKPEYRDSIGEIYLTTTTFYDLKDSNNIDLCSPLGLVTLGRSNDGYKKTEVSGYYYSDSYGNGGNIKYAKEEYDRVVCELGFPELKDLCDFSKTKVTCPKENTQEFLNSNEFTIDVYMSGKDTIDLTIKTIGEEENYFFSNILDLFAKLKEFFR